MSHKIIEKEIEWDAFITFLFTASVLQYIGYCFDISRVRLEHGNIVIHNGPYPFCTLLKEDNQIIKYGLGTFYLNDREYEQEDSGETDHDGYAILKDLSTYKIVEKEFKVHQLKLYEQQS